MKQQINLYEKKRSVGFWIEWKPLPQIALAFLVILAALYAWKASQLSAARQQLQVVEAQHQALEQQFAVLREQLPAVEPDTALQARVDEFERELRLKSNMVAAIGLERVGSRAGFSRQLEGLARHSIKGLWLTRIELRDGGRNIGLQGQTHEPEFVPQLVRRLAQESVYEGIEFDIFSMQSDPESGLLGFDLRASQEE